MSKKIFTVTEVIEKIQDEMDLQEESFIDQNEYISYINEAIDEAEAEIHNLYEFYFKSSSTISLVNGTASYALPTSIYANKIKHVSYKKNSTDYYRVPRIKDAEKAFVEEQINGQYLYDIQNNNTTDGVQIVFYPTPTESVANGITLWFIRNAERVSALTDKVDIPEFHTFIFAFLKVKVALKEDHPLLRSYQAELERQRDLMRRTLSTMIPDEDEELRMDTSFYTDWDDGYGDYW